MVTGGPPFLPVNVSVALVTQMSPFGPTNHPGCPLRLATELARLWAPSAGPPPRKWPETVSCALPVPSELNCADPWKLPRFWQTDGLLQLMEIAAWNPAVLAWALVGAAAVSASGSAGASASTLAQRSRFAFIV